MFFSSLSAQNSEAKYYQLKSGYLKTEYTGNTTGTRELWWDDYGAKSHEVLRTTTTTKLFGMSSIDEVHMLNIRDGAKYWSINYNENSGVVGNVDDVMEVTEGMSEKELQELGEETFEMLGGEKQGTETIGGYKCDLYTVMGTKTWIYKGIPLKSTAKIMGIEMNEMFTEFKPNMSVPSSKFVAPKNIEYQELDQMMEGFYNE